MLDSSTDGACLQLQTQLVWADMERALAEEVDEDALEKKAEEESFLRGGQGDYSTRLIANIEGLHPSSITCVRAWPGRDVAITGSGRKCCLRTRTILAYLEPSF